MAVCQGEVAVGGSCGRQCCQLMVGVGGELLVLMNKTGAK